MALATLAVALCKIGFGLLDGASRARDLRLLFAIVKARQNRALGYPVADIRPEIDQHAGNLEPDLRADARFNGAKPEHLDRDVVLRPGDLDVDRPGEHRPGKHTGANDHRKGDDKRNRASRGDRARPPVPEVAPAQIR